jgi:hypothetical protein
MKCAPSEVHVLLAVTVVRQVSAVVVGATVQLGAKRLVRRGRAAAVLGAVDVAIVLH